MNRSIIKCFLASAISKITVSLKAIAFFIVSIFASQSSALTKEVNILFFGNIEKSHFAGITLGVEEANLQGKFLNFQYNLIENPSKMQLEFINEPIAIITNRNTGELRLLAEQFLESPVFNTASKSNSIREECFENVLNIVPSQRMLDDAREQWRNISKFEEINALAWHPDFKKFAASQLNNRFKEKFQKPMDDGSWSGWVSVKIIAESIIQNNMPEDLLYEIKSISNFDGQKGIGLSFRETGQLRQPILLANSNKLLGYAPVKGVTSTTNLDSLGITECYK